MFGITLVVTLNEGVGLQVIQIKPLMNILQNCFFLFLNAKKKD